MKIFSSLFLLAALTGCAIGPKIQRNWEDIDRGQTEDQVIDLIGKPISFQKDKNGGDVLVWSYNAYTACFVDFSSEGDVSDKTCREDPVAKAQAMALMQSYLQVRAAQPMPAFTPVQYDSQPYQMKIPQQTQCTSMPLGGTVQTNCSTY